MTNEELRKYCDKQLQKQQTQYDRENAIREKQYKTFENALNEQAQAEQVKYQAEMQKIKQDFETGIIQIKKEHLIQRLKDIQNIKNEMLRKITLKSALQWAKELLTPEYLQELIKKWLFPEDFDLSILK